MAGIGTQDTGGTTTGSGTLASGTVTIANINVTANSKIFVSDATNSLTNMGALTVSSQTAGVGFTVKSVNILDSSVFNYVIIG